MNNQLHIPYTISPKAAKYQGVASYRTYKKIYEILWVGEFFVKSNFHFKSTGFGSPLNSSNGFCVVFKNIFIKDELCFVMYSTQLSSSCVALSGVIFFSPLKCFNCTLLI